MASTVVLTAATSFSQPAHLAGFNGFLFDVESDTTINLQSDITDHYVEDNTAIQDHIALKPLQLKLKYYHGELVDYRDTNIGESISRIIYSLGVRNQNVYNYTNMSTSVINKLTTLTQVLPALTPGVSQIQNKLNTALNTQNALNNMINNSFNTLNPLSNFFKSLKTLDRITRQQEAYSFCKELWENKILICVETCYGKFDHMAIESVTPMQDDKTEFMSTFTITLKKIRTASREKVAFDLKKFQERNAVQQQPKTDKGKTQGSKVTERRETPLLQIFKGMMVD